MIILPTRHRRLRWKTFLAHIKAAFTSPSRTPTTRIEAGMSDSVLMKSFHNDSKSPAALDSMGKGCKSAPARAWETILECILSPYAESFPHKYIMAQIWSNRYAWTMVKWGIESSESSSLTARRARARWKQVTDKLALEPSRCPLSGSSPY
ncbi:hypothetical protein SCAR479_02202 [Seiridium cardinale]|uniref:Uncharacterized protein n=1 Tax=Seiridium cardinale TaxID=138064 RepID=A0ABR2X593_9PEZI